MEITWGCKNYKYILEFQLEFLLYVVKLYFKLMVLESQALTCDRFKRFRFLFILLCPLLVIRVSDWVDFFELEFVTGYLLLLLLLLLLFIFGIFAVLNNFNSSSSSFVMLNCLILVRIFVFLLFRLVFWFERIYWAVSTLEESVISTILIFWSILCLLLLLFLLLEFEEDSEDFVFNGFDGLVISLWYSLYSTLFTKKESFLVSHLKLFKFTKTSQILLF